jgi:hypothetical protein
VTAKAQFKTDTDKDKEVAGRLRRDGVENETRTERTRQQVQLEISIVSTQAIGDVRVKVTFLGLRHTLRAEDARSRRAPSYEETRTRIVLLEQDLPVGDLRPLGRRAGRSGVATADYTDISYEMTWLETSLTSDRQTKERDKSGPFRTGTQYRGWILDVYAGGHLVKVVASSRGLFEELGRDPATGFPR